MTTPMIIPRRVSSARFWLFPLTARRIAGMRVDGQGGATVVGASAWLAALRNTSTPQPSGLLRRLTRWPKGHRFYDAFFLAAAPFEIAKIPSYQAVAFDEVFSLVIFGTFSPLKPH